MLKKCLVLLFVLIPLIGCTNQSQSNEAAGETVLMHDDHSNHQAESTQVESTQAAITEDKEQEYTLDASVYEENGDHYLKFETNLKLSPEHYGGPHVEGEGHVHFYLNGGLVGPIKDPEPYLLNRLKEGTNKIKLVLATNSHSERYGVRTELTVEKK